MSFIRSIVYVAKGMWVTRIYGNERNLFNFVCRYRNLQQTILNCCVKSDIKILINTLVTSSISFTAAMVKLSWILCFALPLARAIALSLNIESKHTFSSRSTANSSTPIINRNQFGPRTAIAGLVPDPNGSRNVILDRCNIDNARRTLVAVYKQ